jgi:hypothetical protein
MQREGLHYGTDRIAACNVRVSRNGDPHVTCCYPIGTVMETLTLHAAILHYATDRIAACNVRVSITLPIGLQHVT